MKIEEIEKLGLRPFIGDIVHGAKVGAIGIREGERWCMTVDKHGTVSLWPDGTWGDWKKSKILR